MTRKLVFNAKDVEGFSPAGVNGAFVSRLLVDPDGVGAQSLVVNHFILRPGQTTRPAGSHPAPYDEVYYVLRGRGRLYLGDEPGVFELGPDSVAFIPGGTAHGVDNTGDEDLELLTIMPGPLRPGVNSVYDGRRAAWGTGFRLVTDQAPGAETK
jgi:mannose-6-phosphate isomerase-like protein (cupin superfamily)